MAFWWAELPEGSERGERWRWTVVLDDGKTSHGWAETPDDAWAQVREALHRPNRGTRHRRPRGLWVREP